MVSVVYSILWIIAALKWGDWQNWKRYYPTLLFSVIGNLLYEVVCAVYPMWAMEENGLPNRTLSILLLSIIGMPVSTFVYLSNFPFEKTKMKQVLYILLFVFVFVILEFIAVQFGSITYRNGWNLAWSTLFVVIMFPILTIHYRNPVVALLLSVVVTLGFSVMFDLTLDKMR